MPNPTWVIVWSGLGCAGRASRSTAKPCSVLCSSRAGSAIVDSRNAALRGLSRVQASLCVSDVRWATDATYVWTRLDGLVYVNAVLDCADRQCIGLNVSQRNDAREAAWALEDALIRRFGALPKGDADVTLRTDNALVYASELYRELAKSYGLHQEFILPHTPEQNGVAESFMGTLKLECVWQHRFETYEEAKATITAWVKHYNETRPHSRLGYIPPVAWRELQAEITA